MPLLPIAATAAPTAGRWPSPVARVARVAPAPPAAARVNSGASPREYRDQYTVDSKSDSSLYCARFFELVRAVLCHNDTEGREGSPSTLLGPTGHYERFSAASHFLGFWLFGAYAVARALVVRDSDTLEGSLATAAGATSAAVFLSSTIYHSTAPDRTFSAVTRVLDYVGIYAGITVATTADIAAATDGFKDTPWQTYADLPLATTLIIFFFILRRCGTEGEDTWVEKGGERGFCLLGGMFSRGHRDMLHAATRQATSMLLFASYFLSVPAAFATLGSRTASFVVAMQVVGFLAVTLGMAIDRIFEFPDKFLIEGEKNSPFACRQCGCVLNSHALWHLIALSGAIFSAISREYALAATRA